MLNDSLHAANTVVCCLAAATADSMTGGVSSVIGALMSGTEIYKSFRAPTNLQSQIAQDIEARCKAAALTQGQRLIFLQMVQAAPLSPAEVATHARNPETIARAMLARMTDPEHKTLIAQENFKRILVPLLTHWLDDATFCNWRATLPPMPSPISNLPIATSKRPAPNCSLPARRRRTDWPRRNRAFPAS